MSIGTLSNIGRAQELIRNSDLNVARLSALAGLYGFEGLSEASLSRALTASKPLGTHADRALGVLIGKLEKLVKDVAPLMVSFASPEKVKALLDDIEAKKIVFIILSGLQPE